MPRARKQNDVAAHVQRRLRELRRAQGLTQEALGERAGLSADAISRIEAGTRIPTLATVSRLAYALGVSIVDVVDLRESNPPRKSSEAERIGSLIENEPKAVQRAAVAVVRALVRSMRATADD